MKPSIVISPTMRCNLRCVGCYSSDYSKEDGLSIELIDKIIIEAKKMGIYFYIISGGEPFIRKDILEIYKKHNNVAFLVFTNGTFIDKRLAKKLKELGNVFPAISIEGFEKETDARRGKGIWKKIMKAMDNLREAGVIFGFSGTVTKYNTEVIFSDELIKLLLKKGCTFGWYFTYIPIGKRPDINLMQNPKQKLFGRIKVDYLRSKYRIFIGWNDGMYEKCIAARNYLHINSKGDIEPCVFIHFATHNIKDTTLKEAINSPFFKMIRKEQFDNKDSTQTCIIVDNPKILRKIVKEIKPYPTHENAEKVLTGKCKKCLDKNYKEYSEFIEALKGSDDNVEKN